MKLLSSVYGKIQQVLLVQPGYENRYKHLPFKAICEGYEASDIQLVQLVNQMDASPKPPKPKRSFDDRIVQDFLAKGRAIRLVAKLDVKQFLEEFQRIKEAELPIAQSEWAQDAFCTMEYDGLHNVLLQPVHPGRLRDQFVSTELAMRPELNFLLKPTDLRLEGGNILVGDDYALVGKNTLGQNWVERLNTMTPEQLDDSQYLSEAVASLKEEIRATLGVREIIWVGYSSPQRNLFHDLYITYQPHFHIDLFLTLGGKTRDGEELIFVADPGRGKEIAEKAIGETIDHGLQWDKEPIIEDLVFDIFLRNMEGFFNDYNKTSDGRRFKIVRLPMLIDCGVAYSYNNCLVEVDGDQKRVFLPNYLDDDPQGKATNREKRQYLKFQALKQEVEAIFQAHGFVCAWFGQGLHMQKFASRQGALHCLSKVLRRLPIGSAREEIRAAVAWSGAPESTT